MMSDRFEEQFFYDPQDERDARHEEWATYIPCSICGCEIWNDRESEWLETPIGNLCIRCQKEYTRYGEAL